MPCTANSKNAIQRKRPPAKAKSFDTMRTRIVFPTVIATTLIFASLSYGREGGVPAAPAAAIDATLYTRYHTDQGHTIVDWNVCGSLPGSSGCYGSGTLGPFGMIGALMEGEPKTNPRANTVKRAIYVLDYLSGPNQNEVVLYVYTKVDTITADSDTVTVTLDRTISLPLVGGLPNQCSMAANKKFLFIGTNQNPEAVQIDKRTFSVTQLGGFSPPINTSGITADQYGYVTLSFGSFSSSDQAFIVVGPDGSAEEDGDGNGFMLNTDQAIKISPAIAGIQRPAIAGITDPPRVRRFGYRHDQEDRVLPPPSGPIDATLYTRYNIDRDHTIVGWDVCGSLPGSSGCYGSGSLGPFVRVGALMEGEPTTDANTVTRAIYVLDANSGPNQNEVVLYVYTKVDTITTDSDTVTVTLSQTISLPLVGDPLATGALPFMAANKQFLFIATDQSPFAVEIDKSTLSVTQFGGAPPLNIFGIFVNQYGYGTLSFGCFRCGNTAFNVFDPNANVLEEGDETQFMLDTVQGLLLRP
jgi:hypothetical protein